MPKVFPIKTILAMCCLLLVAVACSKSSDETASAPVAGTGLLSYVPADTAFVFAVLEPLPDELADRLEPRIDAILKSYQRVLRTVVEVGAKNSAESEDGEGLPDEAVAALEEIGKLLSIEGLRSVGIERDSTMVLYGVGLLPVLRIALSDGDLMDAAIARIEEKAKGSMTAATIGGQAYRYAGDEKGRLIVAIIDNQFVLCIVPTNLSDELLKSVLGLTPPASNIADSGRLRKIIKDNGFLSHSVGLVDFERIAATFVDDQSGVNQELLALMEYDSSALDDVCKAEIREIAGIAPRIVTGYTEMSVDRFVSNTILELRGDIASGLAKLPAPVPGLGSNQGGLFSFGMSINLLAAREFYEARLDAMEADPYECELFADLQDGAAQGREALNTPMPPIVYSFTGFLAVIEDIQGMDLANNQPPTSADLRLLVTTDNAAGLLAMGAMFSPEIAGLDIKPDGQPVKFESEQFAGVVDAAYVAMTDNALAISIGQGTEARLGGMLSAAINDPHPFMSVEMDAARYYDFIAKAMAMDHDGDDETPPELKAAIGEMMVVIGDMISRMTFQTVFTPRGVEFPSTVELAE
jgi:hypothetical protein